ncbi:MAG: zf-HC2 domain-containing protein [Acidobacteriia bacterium]|nr:zf-HC2 domain-containing protein [Terriglobia bacterium]
MKSNHLDPEQLVAYRDGELKNTEMLRHLAGCESCQEKLKDSCLFALLLSSPKSEKQDSHPEDDLLVAYLSNALTENDASAVEQHARVCDGCLAQLLDLRKSLINQPTTLPAPQVVERAKRQFRSRQRRRPLGEIFIQPIKDLALGLTYHPLVPDAMAPDAMMDLSELAVGYLKDESPPTPSPDSIVSSNRISRPSERYRLTSSKSKILPSGRGPRQEREEVPRLERPEDLPLASAMSGGGAAGEVVLNVGALRISFNGRLADETPRLEISALHVPTNTPAQRLELTLIPEKGDPLAVETDRHGAAHFDLFTGTSRLLIHTEPTSELLLYFRF